MLPTAATAGAKPRRFWPGGTLSGGGGAARSSRQHRPPQLRHLDRVLLAACLLASLALLYRGLVFAPAGLGGGSEESTVISATTTVVGGSQLGLSLTVRGGSKGGSTSPRSRRAALRQVAARARGAVDAALHAGAAQQRQQRQQPAGKLEGVPADFDAEAYLAYHPDLAQQGITTPEAAAAHYVSRGRAEGRPARRLRVLLRYTACAGLINQQYSHIAAFALAAALGAEVVLPPAVCRDSFAHYFSVYKEKNEVHWSPVPLDTLLDVEAIIGRWAARGTVVHRTPALAPFPDLTQPEAAFPAYPLDGLDPALMVRMGGIYLKDLPLPDLIERARAAVVGRATRALRADPAAPLPYIVLDLPCTFFALRALSALPVVTEVARSLAFSPRLHALADRVVEGVTDGGRLPFNGVHLRVEKDARDWASIMGGQQVVWRGYLRTMRSLGFNATTRLYAASGMLTYGASAEMDRVKNFLLRTGVGSAVHHKEQYIPRAELEALNSEQKALLDFLVLARAARFAGFGSSTFSFYLREYRALQGLPRATSALVDASVIGTDPLFHSAGTVVQRR